MKADIRRRWTAALRSGEYAQGSGQLLFEQADSGARQYCCLGVLCDLAARDGVVEGPVPHEDLGGGVQMAFVGASRWDGSPGVELADVVLPHAVADWAGIEGADPWIVVGTDPAERERLSSLNDEGADFLEIADIIDEHGDEL